MPYLETPKTALGVGAATHTACRTVSVALRRPMPTPYDADQYPYGGRGIGRP